MSEIDTIVEDINSIQDDYALACGRERRELLTRWRDAHHRASLLGFSMKRVGPRGGEKKWKAIPKSAETGGWIMDDHDKRHNNECTTRSIYFCLAHKVDYWTIREMQNARARRVYGRGRCRGWNHERIWGGILADNGFVKMEVSGRITFGQAAERLAGVDARVLLHSLHHCAACHAGAVVDDWDSRRKIIDMIYVPADKSAEVRQALGI